MKSELRGKKRIEEGGGGGGILDRKIYRWVNLIYKTSYSVRVGISPRVRSRLHT